MNPFDWHKQYEFLFFRSFLLSLQVSNWRQVSGAIEPFVQLVLVDPFSMDWLRSGELSIVDCIVLQCASGDVSVDWCDVSVAHCRGGFRRRAVILFAFVGPSCDFTRFGGGDLSASSLEESVASRFFGAAFFVLFPVCKRFGSAGWISSGSLDVYISSFDFGASFSSFFPRRDRFDDWLGSSSCSVDFFFRTV